MEWYEVEKGQRPKGGKRALIAVMRKLALGLYVVGVGTEAFDARRLFSPTVKRSRRDAKQAKKSRRNNEGKKHNLGLCPRPRDFSEAWQGVQGQERSGPERQSSPQGRSCLDAPWSGYPWQVVSPQSLLPFLRAMNCSMIQALASRNKQLTEE